jgi:hypothetical protein
VNDTTGKLKLFVVGESSSDPATWSKWGGRAIVIAHDAEEAYGMVEGFSGVTEIPLDKPVILAIDDFPPSCL